MNKNEPYYEPKDHVYNAPDGMRLEGVTDILQGELGGFDGFPESAAMRGTDVHNAIQFYTENDLDESTLTSEVSGYLECFKAAQKFYANLITPSSRLVLKKLDEVKTLGLFDKRRMIAPSH